MMNFSDIYILTDMDGTLIGSDHAISDINKSAIKRFTEGGGTFGVATGRATHGLPMFVGGLAINGYNIISNGAVIYDLLEDKIIHSGKLDAKMLTPFIEMIIEKVPELSIQFYTDKGLFVASNTGTVDKYIIQNKIPFRFMDFHGFCDLEWNKVIFHSPLKEKLAEVEGLAGECLHDGVETNYSGDMYFEIIPAGYNKGDSLERIRSMEKYVGKKFLSLGDHQNDVRMLEVADFSVCPCTARDEAKKACDLVANISNDEHLLAWVIEKMENGEIDF